MDRKPFLIYQTDAGMRVRAKVLRVFRNGCVRVEPYFFQRDGEDVPGFIGGTTTVFPRHIVPDAA